jgi:hypothetical protein
MLFVQVPGHIRAVSVLLISWLAGMALDSICIPVMH